MTPLFSRHFGGTLFTSCIGVASACLLLTGCWTPAATGDQLLRRVTLLEEGQSTQRQELSEEIQNAQTKVAQLEGVLEQATAVVTRSSADTGAQVETLQGQVQVLEGRLAELRNEVARYQTAATERETRVDQRLQKLARRTGVDVTLDAAQIPEGADEHYQAADTAFEAGEFSLARAYYRTFMTRHADDPRVDNALYRVGATYLSQRQPATALRELRRVIGEHRRGDAAPEALAAMAEAFYQLHACTDARDSLQALIRAYPRSSLVGQVRRRLREMQRAPRGYCTS